MCSQGIILHIITIFVVIICKSAGDSVGNAGEKSRGAITSLRGACTCGRDRGRVEKLFRKRIKIALGRARALQNPSGAQRRVIRRARCPGAVLPAPFVPSARDREGSFVSYGAARRNFRPLRLRRTSAQGGSRGEYRSVVGAIRE